MADCLIPALDLDEVPNAWNVLDNGDVSELFLLVLVIFIFEIPKGIGQP